MESIVLKGLIGNTGVNCLLDCGSSENFISKSLVNELKLHTKPITKRSIELANRTLIDIAEETNIILKLEQTPNTEYKIPIKIMNSLTTDIIFGLKFLFQFSCVLDFRKPLLIIDGTEVEVLEKKTFWNESPDQTMSEKAKVCQVLNSPQKKLEQIISTAKKLNPRLGLIPEFVHRIELKDTTPFGSNGYSVPIALVQPLRDELMKLK